MNNRTAPRSFVLAALITIGSLLPSISNATVVTFHTVMGDIEVNLYDDATPQTVANFLAYVNNGDFSGTVFHRSVPGFIVQGGGFKFDMNLPLNEVPERPSVTNEPEFSNIRGTIAMAKLGGQPNSATSQWFFNLANNSGNLDSQNGGFTVFGQVTGSGMDVVDAIAALPTYNLPPFNDIPLRDYSAADFNNQVPVEEEHLVLVSEIEVTDTAVDTTAGLNMPPNTANSGGGGGGGSSGGGGGGNLTIWAVVSLLAMLLGQRVANRPSRIQIRNSRPSN